MKRFIFIFSVDTIIFLFFLSCGQNPDIPEEDFVKIYASMTIMQDTSSLSQNQIKEKVLSKYHYSDKNYDRTIKFYNSNSERWPKFFDKVVDYIENLRAKTKKVELLVLPRRYVLKNN